MEAVPRLPMISFQLKASPEPTSFSTKLKQVSRHTFYLSQTIDINQYNKPMSQLFKQRININLITLNIINNVF